MKHCIEIQHLKKSFGVIHAVDDISFHVKEGELFAFLGINGAGKSTTIHMICGQLRKDSGSIIVDGYDLEQDMNKMKQSIGIVFQNSVLDSALSVYDNLESRAALYGIYGKEFQMRLKELAKLLDFEDLLKRTLGKLSGGQRRRIDIARALLHKPKLLILDEPTTGLDPQTRKLLWKVIRDLQKKENMSVFLTTHYMEEAAEADYVVILDKGKILAEGTPLQLKSTYTKDCITLYDTSEEEVQMLAHPYIKLRDAYKIEIENTQEATKLIMQYPHVFHDYEISKGNMDDVFLAVTGKQLMGGDEYEDVKNSDKT